MRNWILPLVVLFAWLGLLEGSLPGQEEASRLALPLPLSNAECDRLLLQLRQSASRAAGGGRPIMILEFVKDDSQKRSRDELPVAEASLGPGTSFETALKLARFLTGPEGSRVRSIAYLPKSVSGHAVLIALACDDLVMAPNATLGNATTDERLVDATIRHAYQEIRGRRDQVPEAVVGAMLDPRAKVFQVDEVGGGVRFVDEATLQSWKEEGKIWEEKPITIDGRIAVFSGTQMRQWRWISQLASTPEQVAEFLQLPQLPLLGKGNPTDRKSLLLELRGNVTARKVSQMLRALEEGKKEEQPSVVFFDIDSAGGSLEQSLRMAQSLADLQSEGVETVGYVGHRALGDAAILAMACRTLYVSEGATIGGSGEQTITPKQVYRLEPVWKDLSDRTGKSEGMFYGLIGSGLELNEYSDANGRHIWSEESMLPEREDGEWVKSDRLETKNGLDAATLMRLRWVQAKVPNLEAVAMEWGIDSVPEPKRTSRIEAAVQRLAQLPWLPPILLMVAFAMFMTELSSPGISAPGLISALCFGLFFWIRFLDGTLEWLEVSLFLGGGVLLLIEIIVLPGFGLFGITGILMLIVALVLGSQTFLLPSNDYQLNQMAWNMGQVAAAFLGIVVGLYLIRNQLENLPVFRWLRLSPAGVEDATILAERESVVHWDHYLGKTGVTVTRCNPAGKVLLGAEVVNVITTGNMLEEGHPIRVIEVRGNTVVVEGLDAD